MGELLLNRSTAPARCCSTSTNLCFLQLIIQCSYQSKHPSALALHAVSLPSLPVSCCANVYCLPRQRLVQLRKGRRAVHAQIATGRELE